VGDRTPAVDVVFGVQGEVHADVVARLEQLRRMAGPRSGNHDGGAGRCATSEGVDNAEIGCVARAEVVARDDEEARIGVVAETFRELAHRDDAIGR
jgi:hypothetical protein